MNGRRSELPNNTPEQVREYLEGALAIVAELELADDLRAIAFTKAVDLLASKQIVVEAIQPGIPNLAIPRGKL